MIASELAVLSILGNRRVGGCGDFGYSPPIGLYMPSTDLRSRTSKSFFAE